MTTKTRKMSPAHRAQAKDLAVAYNAYMEAVAGRHNESIVCWGGLLSQSCRETGVTLGNAENRAALIEMARERIERAARIAA